MRFFVRKVREREGVTTIFVALSLTMFFGAAALAVDLGMLATARSEAQNAADAAALAAASAFVYGTRVEPHARQLAAEYAGRNTVRGQPATLAGSDVTFSGDTVRVTVRRPGIPTLFARMLGQNTADIAASAAAAPLTGPAQVPCLLPLAIPDRWQNRRSPGFSLDEGDFYPPLFRRDGTLNPRYVGYGTPGERVVIGGLLSSRGNGNRNGRGNNGNGFGRGNGNGGGNGQGNNGNGRGNGGGNGQGNGAGNGQGNGAGNGNPVQPDEAIPWLPGIWTNWQAVTARVTGCPDGFDLAYSAGDWLRWHQTSRGITALQVLASLGQVLSDPAHAGEYFDQNCLCVRDRNDGDRLVTNSPRYRAMPVFNPETFRPFSNRNMEITHFVGVFIERITSAGLQVRVIPLAGMASGDRDAGPLVKVVRLVQ